MRDILVGEGNFEVFKDGQIVDQVIALEDEADVGLVQLVAFLDVELVDGLIEKMYSPLQAESSMPMMLSSVDFPAPDGPMNVTNSPA